MTKREVEEYIMSQIFPNASHEVTAQNVRNAFAPIVERVWTFLEGEIGDLSQLQTTDKQSVVNAINYVLSKLNHDITLTKQEIDNIGAKVGELEKSIGEDGSERIKEVTTGENFIELPLSIGDRVQISNGQSVATGDVKTLNNDKQLVENWGSVAANKKLFKIVSQSATYIRIMCNGSGTVQVKTYKKSINDQNNQALKTTSLANYQYNGLFFKGVNVARSEIVFTKEDIPAGHKVRIVGETGYGIVGIAQLRIYDASDNYLSIRAEASATCDVELTLPSNYAYAMVRADFDEFASLEVYDLDFTSRNTIIENVDRVSIENERNSTNITALQAETNAHTKSITQLSYSQNATIKTIVKASMNIEDWIALDCVKTPYKVQNYDDIYRCYRDCIEFTIPTSSSGYGGIYTKLSQSIDLSTCHMSLSCCIRQDTSTTNRKSVYVALYSGNQINSANRLMVRVQFVASTTRVGWFHCNVNLQTLSDNASVSTDTVDEFKGANFNPANVTHVGMLVRSTTTGQYNLLHNIEFRSNLKRGGCLIVIDNMNPFVPQMADYAKSKGVITNLSIVPSFIGDDYKHASLETCRRLQDEGHFIFNHTYSHNISQDMTYEDVMDDYNKGGQWMIKNGFVEGATVLSNPSAAYPDTRYYAHMESSASMIYHHWFQETGDLVYYPEYPMSRLLSISHLDSRPKGDVRSTIEAFVSTVQKAVQYGGVAVLGFHGGSWNTNLKDTDFPNDGDGWKYLIDRLTQVENCTFYTIGDLQKGLWF